jgi:hypothetical protein
MIIKTTRFQYDAKKKQEEDDYESQQAQNTRTKNLSKKEGRKTCKIDRAEQNGKHTQM